MIGALGTILVQSSSIFTSALTPLVGVGVITLDRMYPLTLGANIGTTFTAILASLAQDGDSIRQAMQVSMCHLFFNISGIILWYPIPFMRKLPVYLAKKLGDTTADYRWFAIFYLVVMFFVLPGVVFGLSIAGWEVLVGVGAPIVTVILLLVVINILQAKRPQTLPTKLRSWDFLPLWCRSFAPLDKAAKKVFHAFICCKTKRQSNEKEHEKQEDVEMGNGVTTYM